MIARADAIERPRRALHPSGPDLRRDRAALDLNARATILSAAAAVLQDEGPAALTVRRIAQAVNTSTKAIYTHFGGKDGLLDSVYLEGVAGFGRSMSTVPAGSSPPDRLRAMCAAYRGYGRARPAFYNVMFGDMGRAYRAPVESRRKAAETFGILKEAIQGLPERARRRRRRLAGQRRPGHSDPLGRNAWRHEPGIARLAGGIRRCRSGFRARR